MGSIDCEDRRRTGRPQWANTVFYRCDQGVPATIGQAMLEHGRAALRRAHRGCHEPRRQVRKPLDRRIRLVDYILEKKPVTESGCRYCPHCLKETPTVFAICLACWTALESHGFKPYRIIEEEDEEVTTKQQLDEEIRRNKETIFKDVVHEAQEGASQDNDYGFDPNEVDYDEEGDEEMDEAEDDEEVVADDEEEEEAGEAEAAPGVAKIAQVGIEPRRWEHPVARYGDDQH